MPTIDDHPDGAPCWVDLNSSDPARSQAFYASLFGWTADDRGAEYGHYTTFSKDGAQVGGCMANDGSNGAPDLWTVYLATSDAKATVDSAEANGGQAPVPAMDVMDLGAMAVVTDAGGAAVGIWQPGSHTGFGLLAEDGSPAWFELLTRDHDASVAFYREVFGWDTHPMGDTDELRYTTLGSGEEQRAGVMDATAFLPEGVPAHWSVYFLVPDTDAALATVVELGGSVVLPAEDSPHGRTAQVADPTGATFKVVDHG